GASMRRSARPDGGGTLHRQYVEGPDPTTIETTGRTRRGQSATATSRFAVRVALADGVDGLVGGCRNLDRYRLREERRKGLVSPCRSRDGQPAQLGPEGRRVVACVREVDRVHDAEARSEGRRELHGACRERPVARR